MSYRLASVAAAALLLVLLPGCSEADGGTSAVGGSSSGGSQPDGGSTASGGSADAGGTSDVGGSGGSGGGPVVDHSDQLPPGVVPPILRFWRGINQDNLGWYTDGNGRHCANGDTTMWFVCPANGPPDCGGAPACDPDHFQNPDGVTCMGDCCFWRNWDDPRGPEFRVSSATGPVEVHNHGAQGLSGDVPDYGFGVTVCAEPGTVAVIDTCPRSDVYSCVETNYPQLIDACTTVLLNVRDPPAGFDPSQRGCYSTVADVTIQF